MSNKIAFYPKNLTEKVVVAVGFLMFLTFEFSYYYVYDVTLIGTYYNYGLGMFCIDLNSIMILFFPFNFGCFLSFSLIVNLLVMSAVTYTVFLMVGRYIGTDNIAHRSIKVFLFYIMSMPYTSLISGILSVFLLQGGRQ